MQVRPLTPYDFGDVERIARELHPHTAFSTMAYDPSYFLALLDLIVKCPQALFGEVIDTGDGLVVGFLLAQLGRSWFGPDLWAHDMLMTVDPDWAGKCGFALRTLGTHYRQWAAARGAKRIFLGTATEIEPERTASFFKRLGFRQTGTIHCAT